VSLHDQIRECDSILSQMETLLSGFQVCLPLLGNKQVFTCLQLLQ